jgi:hypothetical protein
LKMMKRISLSSNRRERGILVKSRRMRRRK